MIWQLHQVDKTGENHIPFIQYEHTGTRDSGDEMFGAIHNTIHQFPLPDGMKWEVLNENDPHFMGTIVPESEY